MALEKIIDIVCGASAWPSDKDLASTDLFDALFGADTGRYPARSAERVVTLRWLPASFDGVPFGAYIHPTNPNSGAYSGMSIAIFPVTAREPESSTKPALGEVPTGCLLTFVVGTNGLDPDADILGRPGHARKVQAICAWLNKKHGQGRMIAWAKQDPARPDQNVPANVVAQFSNYRPAFDRYGKELYAVFASTDAGAVSDAVMAFFDLMFSERDTAPYVGVRPNPEGIRAEWFAHLMPDTSVNEVYELLKNRRYVVIQGPPGTGKTRMAKDELLPTCYRGNGQTVQFHRTLPTRTSSAASHHHAPTRASA